ncbi:MAG: response regulator transcription factor [Chloroflexota bacterium]|nr:MAG: response regulator transcription factor [Chloroflexota bacterium]TMD87771.1 MAG: response regulator transcription factor [Chloroflexota bacterium]
MATAQAGARILFIDDEPGIRNFVSRGLRGEGFTVDLAPDGDAGLKAALGPPYDLIILDLLLPDLGGIEVLRRLIHQHRGQPVIVLSALGDTPSKVASLEAGADDYLVKPFSFEELLARVRVRLRDARSARTRLTAGPLTLDLIAHQVQTESGRVLLAEREFLLLRELMSSAGDTVSKERLLETVWGYRFDPGSNVVDVYVRRLRAKIGGEAIKTVRGEGYRIDAA